MNSKKVTRYYADCGKGFWKKSQALTHEGSCKCWTNPQNKACKTCSYGSFASYEEDTGDGGYWECGHLKKEEHTGAPNGITYISVNCEFYI